MTQRSLLLLRYAAGLAIALMLPCLAKAQPDEARRQALMESSRASAAAIDRRNSDQAFQAGLARGSSNPPNSGSHSGSSSSSGGNLAGGNFGGSSASSGPQSVVSTRIVRVWVGETLPQMATRLKAESSAGNAQSQYLLARMHASGYGVTTNLTEARRLFAAAAGQRHVEASFFAGELMIHGRGGPVDTVGGMAVLRYAADAGNGDAQALLGLRLMIDAFETSDNSRMPEAVRELERAAEAGKALAQSTLGTTLYYYGVGVPADGVKAVHYLRMGAAQGDPLSLYALGNLMVDGDDWTGEHRVEGWSYISRAAQAGDGRAMWKLAAAKFDGTLSQEKDVAGAVRLMRLSAEAGDRNGQGGWGQMLYFGVGVPENKAEGIRYTRMSAEAHYGLAQLDMAKMSYFGDVGIVKDLKEAVRWARSSAESGFADGQVFYGQLLYGGEGVAKNPQEALRWFRKAAKQGNAEAIKNISEPEMIALERTLVN